MRPVFDFRILDKFVRDEMGLEVKLEAIDRVLGFTSIGFSCNRLGSQTVEVLFNRLSKTYRRVPPSERLTYYLYRALEVVAFKEEYASFLGLNSPYDSLNVIVDDWEDLGAADKQYYRVKKLNEFREYLLNRYSEELV